MLATQRGTGTPDPEYIGTWCMPCGYVDYDESCEEAASRELFEETGLKFSSDMFKLVSVNSNPKSDKRQNISFSYLLDLSDYSLEQLCEQLTSTNSEPDEVSEIRFISLSQISDYKWAFNHEKLCQEILNRNCLQDFPKEKKKLTDKINQCKSMKEINGWKKTFQYYSILSKDDDWDYDFLLSLIEFKLKRMSQYFHTHNIVENENWYGTLCDRAIAILHAEYKTNIILSKDLGEIKVNTRNVHRFFTPG